MRYILPFYLLTVVTAVLVSYDAAAAMSRGFVLASAALAGLAIALAGRQWGARALAWIGVGCALLAAAVAGYFLLTHSWDALAGEAGRGQAAKFGVFQAAGLWIEAHRPAVALAEDVNSNVAGGAIALLAPPGIAAAAYFWERRRVYEGLALTRRILAGIAGLAALALLIALAGLALTTSRGAWAGLAAGAAVAGLLWLAGRAEANLVFGRYTAAAIVLGAGLLLGSCAVFAAATSLPGFDRLLGSATGVGGTALGRAQLWRDGLALAGDYPLTGSGLGSAMMVYSTYAMMLHVGFITHAHNLFLQIALEQGLPGLLAFLGLLAAAWAAVAAPLPADPAERREALRWRLAAAASLAVLVVHGTVDGGPFLSRLAPVAFVPVGFALGTRAPAAGFARRQTAPAGSRMTAIYITAVVLTLGLLPGVRAAVQANLGSLGQTRAELSAYDWPKWPVQDALRRQAPGAPAPVDLRAAVARYRAALALDPRNVTANRRLGQIALSEGDYAAALAHLEAAYAAAPQQPTAFLLGEALAAAGRTDEAAALWRGLKLGNGQLEGREWWHGALGEDQAVQRLKAAEERARS